MVHASFAFKRPTPSAPSSFTSLKDRFSLILPQADAAAANPSRRFLKQAVTPVRSSAANWRGLPSADTCEVASASDTEGHESITARILVHATVQQVWRVLTDFDNLLDVVPNLIACEEVPCPTPNRRRLRQSAGLKCSWWKLQAEALLEIATVEKSDRKKELHFNMIEGDFQEYAGRFMVEESPDGLTSVLVFDAVIKPSETIPRMLFAHAVQIWLPFNLNGIVRKAEKVARIESSISPFVEGSIESQVQLKRPSQETTTIETTDALSKSKPRIRPQRKRASPSDYLGTAFVPLPSAAPDFKKIAAQKESTLPAFELDHGQMKGVEVHLRKLDTVTSLHRRVVCSMRIGAPPKAVWDVLTDYNRLAEFVPNLAESVILPHPRRAPERYQRIRQVVQKFQTYIQLQAESVMDVVERPYSEIQFRQVSGFVQKLQGKFVLEMINNDWSTEEKDTFLTYALEIKTPHSDTPLELIEPVFEQAAIEGLPPNLTAIKQEVLRMQGRPSLSRLSGDFEALRDELVRSYLKNGNVLPTRVQLRKDRRTDIEKAITAHGGSSAVSERMGWKLQNKRRKQRGYWNDFDNLVQELADFSVEYGTKWNGRVPPKADFDRAGRVDLRRAIEKWGGVKAVMELIALENGEDTQAGTSIDPGMERRPSKMRINLKDVDRL